MSYTYKIKTAKRFLRKWTAAQPSPVTQAAIDAQTVANTLCDIPWQEVDVSRATLPSHDAEGLDDNVTNRDSFDAAIFCAGHSGGNHRAYANAACYVVKLPDDAVGKTLESVKVRAMSDPYNSAGLRIAVHTNSTGVIPTDCATARTGIAYASGKAPRTTQTVDGTAYWYAAEETVTLTPVSGTLGKYLMVVVALENYATSRGNWLEGSGCIDGEIEITVDAEISGMDGYSERQYVVATAGNYPFLTGTNTGVKALSLQANGSPLPEYKEAQQTGQYAFGTLDEVLASLDGEVTSVHVAEAVETHAGYYGSAYVSYSYQFATIVGKFSKGTIPGVPGLLVYDMREKTLLENVPILAGAPATGLAERLADGRIARAAVVPVRRAYVNNNTAAIAATHGMCVFGLYAFCSDGAFVYSDKLMPVALLNLGDFTSPANITVKGPVESLILPDAAFSSSVKCMGVVSYVSTYDSGILWKSPLFLTEVEGAVKSVTPYSGNISASGVVMAISILSNAYYSTGSTTTNGTPTFTPGALPTNGIPFTGTLYGIAEYRSDTVNQKALTLFGDFSEVGGKECNRIAVVKYSTGTAITSEMVTIPVLDSELSTSLSAQFRLTHDASGVQEDRSALASATPGQWTLVTNSGVAYSCYSGGLIEQIASLSNKDIVDAARVGSLIFYGETASTTPAGYDASKLDTAGALNADASIGLRSLYAKLYGGELDNITLESSGMSLRPGAGFAIKGATLTLPTTDGSSSSVFLWQIACAYMVLPFAAPRDFHVSKIRLAWSSLASTRGTLAVWLKRAFVSDAPDLKDPAFFLASKGEIDGWELVGTVDPSANSIDFAIDPIEDLTATLMFTACASMDDVNPTTATTLPQGVATGLSVDPVTKTVSGTSGTWRPSITLVE